MSDKPIPALDPKTHRLESYHATYKEAMLRYLTNAQRDVNDAKKKLANAKSGSVLI